MKNFTRMRGFSLIEMIVAMGLFSVVMALGASAYLALIDSNTVVEKSANLSNNVSFALRDMADTIRTGSLYGCDGTPGGDECSTEGNTCFSFTDADFNDHAYMLKSDGSIGRTEGFSCSEEDAVSLTDPLVHIDTLRFYVTGANLANGLQPRVVIVVSGTADERHGGVTTPVRFSLETQTTRRAPNL